MNGEHHQLFSVRKCQRMVRPSALIANKFLRNCVAENKEKGGKEGRRSGIVSGRGVVWWFSSFLTFPHISAFGSGFGSGEFAASRIRTFLKKVKKKVPKTNGFRNFCGCGGRI